MRKNKDTQEYTHNGSFLKSLWLCIRGLFSVAAFAALWVGIVMLEYADQSYMLYIGSIAFVAALVWNLVLPFAQSR